MNDAVILLCGVILLLAVLPMILMGRAFKGAGRRKEGPVGDGVAGTADPGSARVKSGHGTDDSGSLGDSGGGDGGGGGE